MKVYSPSTTKTWMRCPVLNRLQKDGWAPKYLGKKDIAGAIGTAFAAGVGTWNIARQSLEEGRIAPQPGHQQAIATSAMGTGRVVYKELIDRYTAQGFNFSNIEEDYLEAAPAEVERAVAKYCADDPIPSGWRILAVERAFPDYGNARPDLIVRTDNGVAVIDTKSKVSLLAQYRNKTISEFRNTQQSYHYTWMVQETFGEVCDTFIHALCVFRPAFKVDLVTQKLSPESRAAWLGGMQRVWEAMDMEEQGAIPWMSDQHADGFGECPMYRACFDYHYDPQLMKGYYLNTLEQP